MKQLEETIRVLNTFGDPPTEEEALELITEHMTLPQRRAAVAILQELDRGYAKVTDGLKDFWEFFTEPNIARLNSYGTHPENALPFEARYRSERGRTLVTIKHRQTECRLLFADKFARLAASWPA